MSLKKKNSLSQTRLSKTTDPLYISYPYFTESEATSIKEAIVDAYTESQDLANDSGNSLYLLGVQSTVQDMIETRMANFFNKWRASGNSRQCDPHGLAPIYEEVFGINRTELEEEGFLRCLRKFELRTGMKVISNEVSDGPPSEGKGMKGNKGNKEKKKGRKKGHPN
jgi:hypothetical protein